MATPQAWGAGGFSPEGQLTTFDKELLSRFRAATIYTRFGMQKKIPLRGGKSISFRRMEAILGASYQINYSSLALNHSYVPNVSYASGPLALTEGTPGTAIDATWTQVLCTVSQYGQWTKSTDVNEDQSIDDVMGEATKNFSEAMTEAMDLVVRDVVLSGTNVQYASSATTRATVGSGMNLTLAELREASRTLRRYNAKPISGEGGNKFVVITHTDAMSDLGGDSNITNIWQYAGDRGMGSNQLFDTAFHDLPYGFRIFETSLARIYASLGLSGSDVYATMVLGEQFYGTVEFASMPAKVIHKPRGSSGVSDPLDQVSTVGWKASMGAAILNENLGVRIEHGTTVSQIGA